VDQVQRHDYDGDVEADVADVVVGEVAADKSAMFGDEAVDVDADKAAVVAVPKVVGPGSRRTPPALMSRWMLPNVMSIPPCGSEKAEHDVKA
jgi:hypothetical protein